MVLQKRLEFGFNDYNLPVTPRATRSARRRGKFQKRWAYNRMGAFNLLASVTENVLLEKDNSDSSASIGKNQPVYIDSLDANKSMKNECSCDEGSSDKRCPGSASFIVTSSHLNRSVAEKLLYDKSNQMSSKFEVDSSKCAKLRGCKINVNYNNVKDELLKVGKVLPIGAKLDMCSAEDPVEGKNFAVICSNSSAMFSSHDDHIRCSSFPPVLDNAVVVSRDDDETPPWCTQWGTTRNTFHSVTRIENRRIRKILASKYWKPPPKLKHKRITNADGNPKPIFHSKDCCSVQSSQMNIPFKKRKFLLHSSDRNPDGGEKSDDISYLLKKKIGGDASGSSSKIHRVPKMSSSMTRQQTSDCHVKLRIKSFRVPELSVEIPETATVGSLKRTVMEAMTTILGGGLRVGIILQGKKVRDDNKTLLQSGISCNCEVDALGFTLEPNSSRKAPSISPAADPTMVPCLDNHKPLARYPPDPCVSNQRIQETPILSHDTQLTKLLNSVESNHDTAPSSSNTSTDKDAMDSNALVPVPEKDSEALAIMFPAQSKSKCPEFAQRRIRRPFSVAEVESLVQSVEKIGTRRWRDVKLRAFDIANHRTYMDLKDKWKTLVHTARISPQQRRGEPVPQELLDRVLAAHTYWSQQ